MPLLGLMRRRSYQNTHVEKRTADAAKIAQLEQEVARLHREQADLKERLIALEALVSTTRRVALQAAHCQIHCKGTLDEAALARSTHQAQHS